MGGRSALPILHGMWSRDMMIYRVVHYDKKTERVSGSRPVPWPVVAEVKRIAGLGPLDDGLGEYELDEQQVRRVADILRFSPSTDRFYYYLEPYNQPVAPTVAPPVV